MSRAAQHPVHALKTALAVLTVLGLAPLGATPAGAADDVVLTPHGKLVDPTPVEDTTIDPATKAQDPAEIKDMSLAALERETAAEHPKDEGYVYSARNLRDPFVLPAEVRAPERAQDDIPPLERVALSEFRLVAVVKKRGTNYAMVSSSDGKGYTIGVGTRIGSDGGEVRRIMPDAVIVEQVRADEFGELKKSETVIGLRPEEVIP
jgi:Tfp pilus assembly protein PilP